MEIHQTVYATARIDGVLDCTSLKVGTLQTESETTIPVARFYIIAGAQRHPVWALDRLAVVVYSYCQAARENTAGKGADDELGIEINLSANLVSGADTICMVASSIQWHTSGKIRGAAEALIDSLTGGSSSKSDWPFKNAIRLPVATNQ